MSETSHCGTLRWDGSAGSVHLSKYFRDAHWVVRADALSDWIAELKQEYEKLLSETCTGDES